MDLRWILILIRFKCHHNGKICHHFNFPCKVSESVSCFPLWSPTKLEVSGKMPRENLLYIQTSASLRVEVCALSSLFPAQVHESLNFLRQCMSSCPSGIHPRLIQTKGCNEAHKKNYVTYHMNSNM